MSVDQGLVDWVTEALEPLGTVTMRKMMGGATLYLDTIVFAICADDELWFKADGDSDAVWDAQGCDRFTVRFRDGRTETMNYRRAPSDVHDDADAMRHWAALAHQAGVRGASRKQGSGKRRSKRKD